MDNTLIKLLALASVSLLASCGGDASPTPPAPPTPPGSPAGFYVGTSGAGATLREVSTLILDSGRVYSLYSGPAGGPPTHISGAVIGDGSTSGTTFTAPSIRDFNFEGPSVTVGSLTASFTSKTSISGTVNAAVPPVAFTGTYSAAYENTPTLAAVAGTYNGIVGLSAGSEPATVVVAADGTFTGTSFTGCALTGATALHASGNVYDVTVTVGAGCVYPAATVLTGHAYLNGNALHSIVMDPALTDGLIFSGTR